MNALEKAQGFGTQLLWQPDITIDSHEIYYIVVSQPSVCNIWSIIEIIMQVAEILQFEFVDDERRTTVACQSISSSGAFGSGELKSWRAIQSTGKGNTFWQKLSYSLKWDLKRNSLKPGYK